MRLIQIKLAGFKSFVDPTTVKTPGQMVAVVGPNGCGKSNIIDAVRWVLGESRASELRGESMHDVIFSGSSQRVAAARAAVELVFDNQSQRVPGQWGAYTQLAVRRVLAVDEASQYFINNQRVRRRDVYDLFLGTGLGTRGYAIIGQGMINRLIEARPEELRVYLEEAAGVSRYKERRRETENRLRDTRENLERLEDLILEIQQQFKKLKKQAETAQKYQQLKKQKQQMQFALWRLEQNQAFEIQKAKLKEIKTLEVALQGHLTQLSRLQAKGKEQQVRHMQAKKHTQQKQSKLHELNTLVSTTQAELHYVQSNQQRSVQRREQLKQQIAHWQQQNTQFEKQMAQFQEALETAQQQREQAEAKRVNAELQLEDQARTLEKKHQWRDEHRTLLHQHEQQLALLTQRYNDVLSERKQREQRQQELSKQLQKQGNGLALETRIKQYKERVKQKRHELSQWQKDLVVTEEKLPTMQQQAKKKEAQWHDLKQKLIALEERAKTLKEIQQQWASPEDLQIWLNERQWGQVAQLWSYLKVTEGWEPALEAVLGQQLGALIFPQNPLANLDAGALANLSPPKKMNLWFANGANKNQLQSWQGCPPLLQFVQCTDAKVQSLLNLVLQKVWVVKNWQQGFQLAAQLPYGGCLVHPKGHVFNRMGLTLYATHDDQAGMVIRQQELLRLAEKIREKTHAQETAKQLWQEKQKQIEKQQSLLSDKREKTYGLSNELHQIELKIAQSKQTLTQEQERQGYLQQQLDETNQRLQSLGHAKAELEEQLNELESVAETVREAFVQIDEDCISLGQEIESIRQQLRAYEQLDYDWAQRQQRAQDRVKDLKQNKKQAQDQIKILNKELGQLQSDLLSFDANRAQEKLDDALKKRKRCEQQWQQAQVQLTKEQAKLEKWQNKEKSHAQAISPMKESIANLRLEEQQWRLKANQFTQQLSEHQVDLESLDILINQKSAHWKDKTWLNKEAKRTRQKIQAMGPVNLAAVQELSQVKERYNYLLAQQDDLQQAIDTLENAIRKIDRETRVLLWDTFEKVNGFFGTLFPKLFGGGSAKLQMLGDEVLDAGVQVMAQPPGKRNTTIALLSGGEKALTAIALVFALFKLNPAPFCLLDEVDAPLDDANAERFIQLVRSMSEQTQFLFVTHNKITMQKAEQLIGVTMQEQGVSRIVSVDMQTAIQLAEV